MDNAYFEGDQKNLFKKVETGTKHIGQITEMEKSAKFWGEIREKYDRTLEMPWKESVSKELRGTITNVKVFSITDETLEKKTKKRKN